MGFVCHSYIKPIKRQVLSVETFQRNASLSWPPTPYSTPSVSGSLQSSTQAEAAWCRPSLRRPGRQLRIHRVRRAPGRGSGGPDPPALGTAPPARSAPPRPAPDASWGGLLEAPGRWDSTAEPQGCGGCLRETRRAQVGRRESALPAPPVRWSPTRAPRAEPGGGHDAEPCALSRPHDPEHVGPREEGAPRLHLQPRWPRHDPLLLRQRGHLAERHQPAVSAARPPPSANGLSESLLFSCRFSQHLGASKGEIALCSLATPAAPEAA